ncbi:FAD-dependent oxidoreductase [Chloroflexota bacterium]
MNTRGKFSKLFEPATIGQMVIRNRIVMPAMATNLASEDGYVTQQIKDYYEARARGGVGLVIVEASCVDSQRDKHSPRKLFVAEDKFIPGLRELAQVIQKHGAKAALQLHRGGDATKEVMAQVTSTGSSADAKTGGEVSRELTISEIGDTVECYGKAAKRAMEAGFDGVEIHSAHKHFLAQFLSAAWNRRKDKYGGTLNNRARFLMEILQAIRELVGETYPVWCRFNGEETGIPNGITIPEAKDLARMIEEVGSDAISVSAATPSLASTHPPFSPPGWAIPLAQEIKGVVNIPVIAVGRITPEIGEQVLEENKADLIAIGRALKTDSELPNKIASGNFDDIRPCLACNICGVTLRASGERPCVVNAAIGREREYEIIPAGKKRQILIVGGGPAGMEAAMVAAQRGHKVVLCEKGPGLGGQLVLAAVPPYKGEIGKFTNFLAGQLKKLNVKVELNTEVTPALLGRYEPDVVILATGAIPLIPNIAGIGGTNVVTTEDVLANRVEVGERIAILGGGEVGCEVAEYLVEKGKKVTIVETLDRLASGMTEREGRQILLDILAAKGVVMLTQTEGKEILDTGLVIADKDGRRQTIEADTIVLACGSMPNDNLIEELRGVVPELHIAGDCIKPRSILEAIDDGARIARVV